MFPPPISLKECPYCLRQVDARAGYCPICGKKIVKQRDVVYWVRWFAGAFVIVGLTAVIIAILYQILIGESSVTVVCGIPGLALFLIGFAVRLAVRAR